MATISRPLVDFDQYSEAYAAEWQGITDRMRRDTPVAWTEAHGGFWILTKHADILRVEQDWRTFSADNDINNERNGGKGIRIPSYNYRFRLNESDPPDHTALRRLELPVVAPSALPKWFAETQRLTDEHIDAFIESGKCELVDDLAVAVPAKVTLTMLGVPLETWRDYLEGARNAFLSPDDPAFPHGARQRIRSNISNLMDERRANPRGDIISAIALAEVEGVPLAKDDGLGMLMALGFGGFDTTASTILNCLYYLQDHAEEHERLIKDEKYLASAIDEMLRVFPPLVGGLARTVMEDTEMRGQILRKGDRVLMLYNSGNFDDEVFADPYRIDFERKNAR